MVCFGFVLKIKMCMNRSQRIELKALREGVAIQAAETWSHYTASKKKKTQTNQLPHTPYAYYSLFERKRLRSNIVERFILVKGKTHWIDRTQLSAETTTALTFNPIVHRHGSFTLSRIFFCPKKDLWDVVHLKTNESQQ